jgi:hypothetical protein
MTSRLKYLNQTYPWLRLVPTVGVAIVAVLLPSLLLDSQRLGVPSTFHFSLPWTFHSAAPAEERPLGLRVTSKPQQVEVVWDHSSQAIRQAEKGIMRISDGDLTEAVPMDARQLQDGSIVYRRLTNDVSVRMEVNERDGRQVSESVRVVATP